MCHEINTVSNAKVKNSMHPWLRRENVSLLNHSSYGAQTLIIRNPFRLQHLGHRSVIPRISGSASRIGMDLERV